MAQKSLAAQNDAITIDISRLRNGAVAVTTGAGVAAGAVFVLEFSGTNSATGAKEWVGPITMIDPTSNSAVTNLTGPSKSGWADCPAYSSVRVRRTDGTGGDGTVAIDHREN